MHVTCTLSNMSLPEEPPNHLFNVLDGALVCAHAGVDRHVALPWRPGERPQADIKLLKVDTGCEKQRLVTYQQGGEISLSRYCA